jgi:hypothetical protein
MLHRILNARRLYYLHHRFDQQFDRALIAHSWMTDAGFFACFIPGKCANHVG